MSAAIGGIGELSEDLRARLWPLGLRVYAERPKALVRRYGGYWQAWLGEGERVALKAA